MKPTEHRIPQGREPVKTEDSTNGAKVGGIGYIGPATAYLVRVAPFYRAAGRGQRVIDVARARSGGGDAA